MLCILIVLLPISVRAPQVGVKGYSRDYSLFLVPPCDRGARIDIRPTRKLILQRAVPKHRWDRMAIPFALAPNFNLGYKSCWLTNWYRVRKSRRPVFCGHYMLTL